MHNTRRKPDRDEHLVQSRNEMGDLHLQSDMIEARNAYEDAIECVDGWRDYIPDHSDRKIVLLNENERWPRGPASGCIKNVVGIRGYEFAVELLWFVASILEYNPSYFYWDTKRKRWDSDPASVIRRSCGLYASFSRKPQQRILRKIAGPLYLERYRR